MVESILNWSEKAFLYIFNVLTRGLWTVKMVVSTCIRNLRGTVNWAMASSMWCKCVLLYLLPLMAEHYQYEYSAFSSCCYIITKLKDRLNDSCAIIHNGKGSVLSSKRRCTLIIPACLPVPQIMPFLGRKDPLGIYILLT